MKHCALINDALVRTASDWLECDDDDHNISVGGAWRCALAQHSFAAYTAEHACDCMYWQCVLLLDVSK